MLVWQRPQQNAIHHGEHGRVRADAERKRHNGDERKTRRFAQHAQSVARVLNQRARFASVLRYYTQNRGRSAGILFTLSREGPAILCPATPQETAGNMPALR